MIPALQNKYNNIVVCARRSPSCDKACLFIYGVKVGHLYNCRSIASSSDFKCISPDWDDVSMTSEILSGVHDFVRLGWYFRTIYCIPDQPSGVCQIIEES